MKYYIAKGPIEKFKHEWAYSYYKVYPDRSAEATRFYSDGKIVNDTIRCFNVIFISNHCKEITEEEYESMLEL
jgi:hypothetical protein